MQPQHLQAIKFYKKDAEYGFLSNLYKSPFTSNGKNYATAEHYFQSKKFEGKPFEDEVAKAKTSFDAFKMGQSCDHPIRKDWSEQKENIMYAALRLKFTQNQNLGKQLLQTENKELIQHTEKDSYWGDGGNGQGKNRLGFLLMKLRGELKK